MIAGTVKSILLLREVSSKRKPFPLNLEIHFKAESFNSIKFKT